MYHFFVTPAQIADGYAVITGQDVNHIRNVLRMKAGEQVGIRDGISRSYICELENIGGEEIRARILEEDTNLSELPAELYLFQGLPKSDKMELIIQKAVELGVHEVIPMATRRARPEKRRIQVKTLEYHCGECGQAVRPYDDPPGSQCADNEGSVCLCKRLRGKSDPV